MQGALAYVAIEQGRFAEGEARYRKALRINPVDSMSLANLGALMLRQGKDSQALDLLQRADNTQPGKPLVQDRLAVALVRLGKVDEGLVLFRRLVSEPHPAEFEAHYALALEIKGQTSEALSILRRAVVAEPGNAELHFNLGTMLAQHNQFAQAVPHLREALRLDPSIPGVAQSLSNALEDAQRHP